jgi:hypothetical protein
LSKFKLGVGSTDARYRDALARCHDYLMISAAAVHDLPLLQVLLWASRALLSMSIVLILLTDVAIERKSRQGIALSCIIS